jgi:hypothetical protein
MASSGRTTLTVTLRWITLALRAGTTGRRPFGTLRVALSIVEGRHDDTTTRTIRWPFGPDTKIHKEHEAHQGIGLNINGSSRQRSQSVEEIGVFLCAL